jgi:hypothetical protein
VDDVKGRAMQLATRLFALQDCVEQRLHEHCQFVMMCGPLSEFHPSLSSRIMNTQEGSSICTVMGSFYKSLHAISRKESNMARTSHVVLLT